MLYHDAGKSSGLACAKELVDDRIQLDPNIADCAHTKMYDLLCDVLKNNRIIR